METKLKTKKNMNEEKKIEKKNNEEIALMFYKLYEKINSSTLSDKTKQDIKKDISKIQKVCEIKPLPNNTISVLKNLGVI